VVLIIKSQNMRTTHNLKQLGILRKKLRQEMTEPEWRLWLMSVVAYTLIGSAPRSVVGYLAVL